MILTLLGILLRPGTLVKRGAEREALASVCDELLRLDRPPLPR